MKILPRTIFLLTVCHEHGSCQYTRYSIDIFQWPIPLCINQQYSKPISLKYFLRESLSSDKPTFFHSQLLATFTWTDETDDRNKQREENRIQKLYEMIAEFFRYTRADNFYFDSSKIWID